MRSRTVHRTIAFATACCAVLAAASLAAADPGSYRRIPTTDRTAIEAAEFAVAQQAQTTGTPLSLASLVRVDRQVDGGINYRLCLRVDRGAAGSDTAVVVVHRDPSQAFSMESWEWMACRR